jgi:MFS family permease
MAAQFTWFTGAGLVGQTLAFFIFDYFSIKRVMLWSHLVCGCALLGIFLTQNFNLLWLCFSLFGIAISTAICGSSTLIAQLWDGRARQSAIVAQDAMFNGGGVLFAALTTWFLTHQYPYASTYLILVAVIGFVVWLILFSDFKPVAHPSVATTTSNKTEWNARLILLGLSILLFMLAKISIFIWAPQYIVAELGGAVALSGQFMSNIFTTAFLGSLAGTWLVAHINVRYIVYTFVSLSLASILMLASTSNVDTVLLIAFSYGLSVSATFNAYVAFALSQVARPNHRNVAYLLLCSSLGSACAPLLSSRIVEIEGNMQPVLYFAALLLVVVIATLIITELLAWKHTRQVALALR